GWNDGFTNWLSGSLSSYEAGKVSHLAMNNRNTNIDGDYAADTAANEVPGTSGDSGTGELTSIPFTLPKLKQSSSAPTLPIIASGGGCSLVWSGAGQLQTTANLSASFVTLPNATSPYKLPMTAPDAFYRLMVP